MHIREYQATATGAIRHIPKHRVDRVGGQIICDSFPNKDRRLAGIKSRLLQRLRQALPVEINLHKAHVGRQFFKKAAQPRDLCSNCRGMVDLKSGDRTDARKAIKAAVKTCTKHDDLTETILQSL